MKRISLLGLSTFAALLLSNCSNEDMVEKTAVQGDAVVTATIDGSNARVNIAEESGNFSWSKEDNIGVYTTNNTFSTFTLKGDGGGAHGEFDGSFGGYESTLCAVYPANGSHTVSDKTLTFHMAESYKWAEGNTNVPMVASIKDNGSTSYYFTHLGGAFRFIVTNWPAAAAKVVFTTSSKITGDFTVDLSQAEPYAIATSEESQNQSNSVTITFSDADITPNAEGDVEKRFYIPVPTGEYKGYEFEIQDAAGTILNKYVSVATNEVKRRVFLDIPKITFTSVEGSITADASSADDLNNLLNPTSTASAPTAITLTGEATKVNSILIPATYTSTGAGEGTAKPLSLVFDKVPVVASGSNKVEIRETSSSTSAPAQTSASVIEIAIPEKESEETVPSFDIELPANTVALSANGTTATYDEVTATTAMNTLIVNKGVTVKKLIVKGGNVEIKGTVNELIIESNNTTTNSVKVIEEGLCEAYQNNGKNVAYKHIWDGISKREPKKKGDTYQIYAAAELAWFQGEKESTAKGNVKATMDADAQLFNDIDLDDKPWMGIVLGAGKTFDGQNNMISNLRVEEYSLDEDSKATKKACAGLFSTTLAGSTVKDVKLENVNIEVEAKWCGALIGHSYSSTVSGCKVKEATIGKATSTDPTHYSYRMGGLIGYVDCVSDVAISGCDVEGATITGAYALGGLLGTTMWAYNVTVSGCNVTSITLTLDQAALKHIASVASNGPYAPYIGYNGMMVGSVQQENGKKLTFDKCVVGASITDDIRQQWLCSELTDDLGRTFIGGNSWIGRVGGKDLPSGNTQIILQGGCTEGGNSVDKTFVKGVDYNAYSDSATGSGKTEGYTSTDAKWAN